jgi:hypothetical protein
MDPLPWGEVMAHVELIHRSVGSRMQWELAAASFAHTSDGSRRDIQANVDSYLKFEIGRDGNNEGKHRLYDQMPDEQRVLAVGSSLKHEGMGFLDKRPHHREWLKEKGISPDECRLRYTQWRERVDASKESDRSEPIGGGGDG